jgi:hypothetical protein
MTIKELYKEQTWKIFAFKMGRVLSKCRERVPSH